MFTRKLLQKIKGQIPLMILFFIIIIIIIIMFRKD